MTKTTMTTTAGAPIADNQNTLTAGPRGPLLLQDYQLIEKLAHQNRERIPERVVHAKGSARLWHADHHRRHHPIHQGQGLLRARQQTRCVPALLDCRRRARRGRCRARRARLRAEILHRRGQLGPRRQQHAGVLRARPAASSPTSSTRRSAIPPRNLRSPTAMWDFWSLSPGEPAPGHDPVLRSRPAAELPPHATASARTPTRSSTTAASASG